MQQRNRIAITEFCLMNDIELSFVESLSQSGLIQINAGYLDVEQLHKLETIVCFYYELDINLEGIETITHLLDRISIMQNEMRLLKNRIRLYESEI
ncbi:MAG: chaperone modulator CbpM [Bacteroidales bacterium]|nr:chaperone modulator CbpM [Bacteroidales bacterium]